MDLIQSSAPGPAGQVTDDGAQPAAAELLRFEREAEHLARIAEEVAQ